MLDELNRDINYMRVSVTDRCNLRCSYCLPEGLAPRGHEDILRYEEILRLCGIAAGLGIRRFKITGGEPLVRKGCLDFLRRLTALPGVEDVTLTTNGLLLEEHIDELRALGIESVNISLDTLNPDTYKRLTGSDSFGRVWSALTAAVAAGLRVKVNCVPLLGWNDGELTAIAGLAARFPLDVRFIELMPTGNSHEADRISGKQVLAGLLTVYPDLVRDETAHGFGPARYWRCGALRGSIGFIDPITEHFCAECNRVRLTSEGFFKLCLYHEDGVDLRALLRQGAGDEAIAAAIRAGIARKPRQHLFGDRAGGRIGSLSRIGG